MNITPTENRILFRIHDARKDSTIILPEGSTLQPYGECLAIGPEVKGISVGDKLLCMMNAAIVIPHNGENLFILTEGCVLGKYVGEESRTSLNGEALPIGGNPA